jgi:hypothetical protein
VSFVVKSVGVSFIGGRWRLLIAEHNGLEFDLDLETLCYTQNPAVKRADTGLGRALRQDRQGAKPEARAAAIVAAEDERTLGAAAKAVAEAMEALDPEDRRLFEEEEEGAPEGLPWE